MLFADLKLSGVGVFQDTAFNKNFGGFRYGADDFGMAVLGQHENSPGDQKISDENTGVASPLGIYGFVPSPDGGFIYYIVVEQGG